MTDFNSSEYTIASALSKLGDRVKELEAFDNAIFQIKTTTGQPVARGEFHFCINTFDATVEVFADGSWRNLIVGGGYTDENAQDAVGSILTDTGTIDFTYDDATPEITADVIPGGVDHDSLLNYVANEHIDHTAVTLTAGDGLSGGGDISANRTFALDLNELGVEVTIAAGDFISMVDITDNGSQKITFANLESFVDHGNLAGLDTGADHSYIDQDITSGSSPTFDGTNFTGIPDAGLDLDYVEVAGDTMTGALIIEKTATEALLVRKDADGGDVLIVDTTNDELELPTGSIKLVSTTSSATGVIYKGANAFIHDFHHPTGGGAVPDGQNLFIGELAGNFTMGSTATETYHSTYNVGIGRNALVFNAKGYQNVAVGAYSLHRNADASRNVAMGFSALRENTSGGSLTAVGTDAGRYIANGSTANQTSDFGVYIGRLTKAGADNNQNEIVIGYNAIGAGSNTVQLGNTSVILTKTYGSTLIERTGTEALLVRKDADAGDVFTVDTTNSIVTATANVYPGTDDTYYLGKNDDDSPFAWKGVIVKDTTDGKYYRIEVISGVVTATDLTD